MRYRLSNETVYSAKYHIIWCPKYRRRVLAGQVALRGKQVIAEVVSEAGGEVIEVEVMPDHVHLLVEVLEVPPAVALSKLVRALKGRSSRLLRAELPALGRLRAGWSRSSFVSTVGGAPLEVVCCYVENQRKVA